VHENESWEIYASVFVYIYICKYIHVHVYTTRKQLKGQFWRNIPAYTGCHKRRKINHRVCTCHIQSVSTGWTYAFRIHWRMAEGETRRDRGRDGELLFTVEWIATRKCRNLYFGEINRKRKMSPTAEPFDCQYAPCGFTSNLMADCWISRCILIHRPYLYHLTKLHSWRFWRNPSQIFLHLKKIYVYGNNFYIN